MEKTLGQIYREGMYGVNLPAIGDGIQFEMDRQAKGIAAVARHVFREELAKHVAEYHANELSDDEAKALLSLPVVHEHGVSREPAKPAEPPKPEAATDRGDWAMEVAKRFSVLSMASKLGGEKFGLDESAAIIREAAERHYGAAFREEVERTAQAIQERDAARERLKENGERITQLQGYMIALADVVGASYPSPLTDATFAANIMAATKKTIAERDAARAECEKLKAALKLAESKCNWTLEVGPNMTPVAVVKDAPTPNETSCLGVLMKIGALLQLPGPVVNPGDVLAAVERLVKPPMTSLPTPTENPNGFHGRYRIAKHDGTPCDPQAMYFVLRIDWGGKDSHHVAACRDAAREYCRRAPDRLKQMANELTRWLDSTERKTEHPTPAASTNDDELKSKLIGAFKMWKKDDNDRRQPEDVAYVAVRLAFDALRRERDEWKEKDASRNTIYKLAIAQADRDLKRAESAEAALAEVRSACEWITCSGCSPSKGQDGRWRSMFLPGDGIEAATLADAILAAHRTTKATPVAEGPVKP